MLTAQTDAASGSLTFPSAPPLRVRDYARHALSPRHRPVVHALAEALFSQEGTTPKERWGEFIDVVDAFLAPSSFMLRFGLCAVLDLIRVLPLLIIGKFALFDELPFADRVRMLERLERSRFVLFALVLVSWKTVMTILYFEHPVERAAIGYPGEARHRYLKQAPSAVNETEGGAP